MNASLENAHSTDILRGILGIVFSSFCFAVMGALVHLAGDLPFMQKAFFRNLISVFITFPMLAKNRENISIPKGSLKFLLLRASVGSIGIIGNFYALDRIPIADAAILNRMSSFFAIIFSLILLGEKIKFVPFLATLGAFFGAMFVIKPSSNFIGSFPAFVGFLGGMGAGFAFACVRKLGAMKINGSVVIAFFSSFSCLLCVPFIIVNHAPMTFAQVLILLGTGLAGCGGQYGMTYGYYHAPARDISIFDYTQIIFSAALGYFLFRQIPDLLSWIGYAIIISMAVIVFLYNKKIGEFKI